MTIYELAQVIQSDWKRQGKGVNYAAKPYLEAMFCLESITDNYIADKGTSIVNYFLANAQTWKGETAKAVKAELKARVKQAWS